METQRTHIVISQQLVAQIDALVGKRARSRFLTRAAEKELKRQRLLSALHSAAGAWKNKDHPELKRGVVAWVEQMRLSGDKRLTKKIAQ